MGKKGRSNHKGHVIAPEIDWVKHEAMHRQSLGLPPKPESISRSPGGIIRRQEARSFFRILIGFSPDMEQFLFNNNCREYFEDQIPGIKVGFKGRSKKPDSSIPLTNPRIVSKSGLLVVTSRVGNPFVEEVGNEQYGSVTRTDEPDMRGEFEGKNRINVAIPSMEATDDNLRSMNQLLHDSISECGGLSLSPVIAFNGDLTPWAQRRRRELGFGS